jgi:crotonobetainyl-CoA:carnitine CoA-transferase CaiB-like acyl-CoA transferase
MVRKTLELKDAERSIEIAEARAIADKKEQELRNQELLNTLALNEKEATKKLEIQAAVNRLKEAEQSATMQAKFDVQDLLNKIHAEEEARETAAHAADLARRKEAQAQEIEHAKQLAEIEKAKQEAYAKTVASVMSSISPDLIVSLETSGKLNFAATLAEHMSPYAISQNKGVTEVTTHLLNGLGFDDIVDIMKSKN